METTQQATHTAYATEARNVVVDFHGHRAVDDVSLGVVKGEVCAVIGPSGSGKSTLLRTFNHLQAPTSGSIYLDGAPTFAGRRPRPNELTHLRRRVGMCFQSFNLFPHLSAIENVMLAQTRALKRDKVSARARGMELLERVGLAEKANARPSQCSGGQQQRIAIARALALDPAIMLFDEPTSALDPELGAEVLAVMRELAETGMTMIVVTHEMHFAESVADHVVFMADGRIVEEGEPTQVLRHPAHERTQRFLKAVIDR